MVPEFAGELGWVVAAGESRAFDPVENCDESGGEVGYIG
jgi:hypothetical protein